MYKEVFENRKTTDTSQSLRYELPKESLKKLKSVFDVYDDEKKGCKNVTAVEMQKKGNILMDINLVSDKILSVFKMGLYFKSEMKLI